MSQEKNNDQEKTEEPTQRKLDKAKEEGNVSRSQEISSVMLLIMGTLVMYHSGGYIYSQVEEMFRYFFMMIDQPINNTNQAFSVIESALWYGFAIITPLLIVLIVTAILVNIAQTGVVFSTKVLEFKPSRLSPANGLKRIFSMKGLMELFKGITKIFIVGMVIYFTVRGSIQEFINLQLMPLDYILRESGETVLLVIARILAALLVLSLIDMIYQRFQHRKDLRMTKQEVKDEFKQTEGDPQVKSQRKKAAMNMRQKKRLDHAVLDSDAVVANPTHYAVALKYNHEEDEAPRIMAKGMRKRALQIREYAEYYDVPILENPPLARSLHASADEDEQVPPELYQAVAEILAYVYRIRKQKAA